MSHGRKSFYEGLYSECVSLAGRLVHEQLTRSKFLALRSAIQSRQAYAQSTASAKREALSFLRGTEEMLHLAGHIVWRHRAADGTWIVGQVADYSTIDFSQSRHVWATTNKVWFGE